MTESFTPPKSNDNKEQPWLKSYPVDIDWNSDITPSTMTAFWDESVRKHGDRVCTTFFGKELTYKEVDKMVDHFAKGLQKKGLGKGATIGLCLPTSPFYLVAYYGALKAGARVANFDPTSPAEALAQQIKDSKTDAM